MGTLRCLAVALKSWPSQWHDQTSSTRPDFFAQPEAARFAIASLIIIWTHDIHTSAGVLEECCMQGGRQRLLRCNAELWQGPYHQLLRRHDPVQVLPAHESDRLLREHAHLRHGAWAL